MTTGKGGFWFILSFVMILNKGMATFSYNDELSQLEKSNRSRLYLMNFSGISSIETATTSELFLSPIHKFNAENAKYRKKNAKFCSSLKCNTNGLLLVLMLKCGDVSPNPGPRYNKGDSDMSMFNKRGLHFIHLNARSILPKMSELKLLVLETRAAVVCITETWLDETVSDNEIAIEGFTVIRKDRNRNGGGVCTFIREDIAFRQRDDLNCDAVEGIWCDLLLPKSKPILAGTIYRPPSHYEFVRHLEDILMKIRNSAELVILGDFNIDINNTTSGIYKRYIDILKLFSLKQLIKEDTRVTDTSSSTIDHILCNNPDKICQSGVLQIGISDHFATFCTRKITRSQVSESKVINIRSLKNYDVDAFMDALSDVDWSINETDVNSSWNNFKTTFLSVLDKFAPMKKVRVKQRTEKWMTPEILSKIRERDDVLRKFNKDRQNVDLYKGYCKLRNEIQRDIKKAKAQFIMNKLDENKSNPRLLWQQLKGLGYSKKSNGKSNVSLDIDGQVSCDSSKIANHFNKFFTNIASILVNKLPNPCNIYTPESDKFSEFYLHKVTDAGRFKLEATDEEFVESQLKCLNTSKATGLDNIPARFLRDAATVLKVPITKIINISITSNTVPDDFKVAKVRPLYKKNKRTDVNNYRPVSILSVVSKILERVVHQQLTEYLRQNNLLYELQSGFRECHSTDTCLIQLIDYIKTQMSRGLYSSMVLLDLEKAFDTVNHDILFNKLKCIGVDTIDWFRSYLTGRKQVVNINNVTSDPQEIVYGVPQGSILGPLLFLVYINDISISIDPECKLFLYADDTAIVYSHKDPKTIQEKLGSNLINCNKWLVDNKLSLHVGKTVCTLFGSSRKLNEFKIECSGNVIKRESSINYLGVDIDQHVSGEAVANSVIKKANSRLTFLYRQAEVLNQKSRKILASALIQCLFDYSASSWYAGLTKNLKHRLQTTQNKMIRFITDKGPRSHVGQFELSELGFLKVDDRVKFLRLCHVFKIFNDISPVYMHEHFSRISMSHNHNTRGSSLNFRIPNIKSVASSTFYYNSIKDWNSLPKEI